MSFKFAFAHTNPFRVKDEKAFKKWAASLYLNILEDDINGVRHFALYVEPIYDDSSGDWPDVVRDEKGHETEVDFRCQLREHLQQGSVAILLYSHSCKDGPYAGIEAMDSNGGHLKKDLHDICHWAGQALGGTAETLGAAGFWM